MDKYCIVFNLFQGYTTINTVRNYCSCDHNCYICNCGASKNGSISSLDVWTAKFFDEYIVWHHSGTAKLCSWIALEMDMCVQDRKSLVQAALLHDIGKLFIPHIILTKMGILSDEEMAVMKTHSSAGADFLSNIGVPDDIVMATRHHHERFDGTGYPDGLSRYDIPLNSRIISVADTLDAMLSGRHYHISKYSHFEIVKVLENGAETQYDSQITDIAVKYIL